MIKQLPQTPNVGPETPKDLWTWLIELGSRIRQLVDWVNNYAVPGVAAHASTHKTGGSDALTPGDIGAVALGQLLASFGQIGYVKIPVVDGGIVKTFVFQWGWRNLTADGSAGAVTFSPEFSSTCFGVSGVLSYSSGPGRLVSSTPTKTGVNFYQLGGTSTNTVFWCAYGD